MGTVEGMQAQMLPVQREQTDLLMLVVGLVALWVVGRIPERVGVPEDGRPAGSAAYPPL